MQITIRHATENDLQPILDIYNDAVVNTTAVYDYDPRTMDAQKIWYKAKLDANFPVLVAENDSKVVGFCSYGTFRIWPAYSKTVEWSVYVSPETRGQGIASQLLQALVNEAKAQGYHTIIAGIDATNEGSIALHKKLGFEEAGLLKEVGWKFERWLDLLFMQLKISNR